ncbi:DUF305 domain-containing protein [Actinocrispum sp. NPDC049592]|uniref:DUF305 domain-containing protein n=1 Tax=Actinocrispum sp. NPDC049592 TaxID=3154835 RepID=UPI0034164C2C
MPGRPGESAKTLSPSEAAKAQPRAGFNDADVKYVRMMITHHQQAIEMAGLAPGRAARDDVKAIASRIADTQGPDIKAMEAWISKNKAPEHQMTEAMPGMASAEQLSALRAAAGPAFDTMFLQLMIAHHEGALVMASDLLQTGSDVFVEEMAQDVMVTQQKEIAQMKAMLS